MAFMKNWRLEPGAPVNFIAGFEVPGRKKILKKDTGGEVLHREV